MILCTQSKVGNIFLNKKTNCVNITHLLAEIFMPRTNNYYVEFCSNLTLTEKPITGSKSYEDLIDALGAAEPAINKPDTIAQASDSIATSENTLSVNKRYIDEHISQSFFKKTSRVEQVFNREAFEKKAGAFLNTYQQPERRSLSSFDELLNAPFIIGEAHCEGAPKLFLQDQFATLKRNGFDVLFMEHLYYNQQHLLDEYSLEGKMPSEIELKLNRLTWGHDIRGKNTFLSLVKAAQAAGLRVVALDIQNVYKAQTIDESGRQQDSFRHTSFSYTAQQIIQNECNEGEKWVALMGNTHVNTWNNIPGVAELTGARSVYICVQEKEPVSIKFNEPQVGDTALRPAHVLITVPPEYSKLPKILIDDCGTDLRIQGLLR
jgi:hypothetical protein